MTSRWRASRLRTSLVVATAILSLGALTPLRAGGSTIDDKKQEAAQLEQEIQNNGDRIAALGEEYNGAVLEYQSAQAGVADAKRHLATAQKQQEQLSNLVAARGAELYQGAQDPTSLLPNTNIQSVNELGVRTQYGAVATGNDVQLISNLVRAKQDLKIQQKQFDEQVTSAQQKRDFIALAQQKVQEANSQEKELLSQVKGEIATLIAQEQARKAAEVKAALERLSHQGNGASRVPSSDVGAGEIPNLPAPSPRAAAAIAATHTGDYVRIQPIGRNPVGAARP